VIMCQQPTHESPDFVAVSGPVARVAPFLTRLKQHVRRRTQDTAGERRFGAKRAATSARPAFKEPHHGCDDPGTAYCERDGGRWGMRADPAAGCGARYREIGP